jgi:TolA-binding protein
MALLRAGRNEEAASAFHSFAQSQPTASQAEDASFLEAVALARAGRGDAAGLAAQRHLESFPGSFHRRQASLLVAKAAAQRGDCSRARSVLAPWPTDPEAIAALSVCPP